MSSSHRNKNRTSNVSRNNNSSQNTSNNSTPANVLPRPAMNAWSRPLQQNRIRGTSEKSSNRPPSSRNATSAATSAPPGLTKSVNPYSTSPLLNNLRARFLLLSQALMGQRVTVTLTSGDVLEGILHTFTPFQEGANKKKYVIKASKFIKSAEPKQEGRTLILNFEEVRNIVAKSIRLEGGPHKNTNGSLITDTDISSKLPNGAQNGNGRRSKDGVDDLIAAGSAWMSGPSENGIGSLSSRAEALKIGGGSSSSGLKGSIGQWDQFSENEKLFNVKATFDEDVYTTSLDRKSLDATQIEKAEKMAKEIEGTASSNIHIAEERGHKIESDFDEEDLYSGVIRRDIKAATSSSSGGSNGVWGKKGAMIEAEKKKKEESSSPPPIKKNYAAVAAAAVSQSTTGTVKNLKSKPSPTVDASPRTKNETVTAEKTEKVTNVATSVAPVAEKDETIAKVEDEPNSMDKRNVENEKENGEENSASKDSASNDATDILKKHADTTSKTKSKEGSSKNVEKEEKKNEVEKVTKTTSKLNANAKSFSFNPSAKAFTPSGTTSTTTQQQPAALQQPGMDETYAGGMVGYMPHQQHYMPHMQPGMMPMMSNQMGTGGMRYPGPGAYGQYPMQHHPIAQISSQPPQQASTQEATTGFDSATSTTSSSETPSEQPQTTAAPTQNIQQHPYGVSGYYASSSAHQAQATMMHRGTPHMGTGYPTHHNIPQQYPMHGATSSPHYRAIYQPHMPQHSIPHGGHGSQQMHPGGYYNPMSAATGAQSAMHGYPPSYANMGTVTHNMGEDGEQSFRGGRGRGGGGRGRKNGRKGGRGGNGGRGGYHQSNNNQGSQQHQGNSAVEEDTNKTEKNVSDTNAEGETVDNSNASD